METRFSLLSQQVEKMRRQIDEPRPLDNTVLSGGIRAAITSYSEAKDRQDDWFSRFNLTVIIIHEHNDIAFKKLIKESYDSFGDWAGKRCLLIPFLAPDKEHDYVNDTFLKTFLKVSDIDSADELDKIRDVFNLKGHKSPLLLLTNDVRGLEYYIIPTSVGKFLGQLNEIIKCSNNDICRSKDIKDLVVKLTYKQQLPSESEKPILEILADIESEHIDKMEIDNEEILEAKRKWRDKIIKDQVSYIIETSQDLIDQGVIDERLFKPIIYALLPKGEVDEDPNDSKKYTIDDKLMSGCEEDAIDVKKMFNDLSLRYLNDSTNENYHMARKMMCLCLGQMFEIEVKYSIVQKMRQTLGIEMPEFYCRLKPEFGKVEVQCERKKVSLNYFDKRTHYWQPPTLGEARSVFMELIKEKDFIKSISEDLVSQQFVEKWNVITEYRNSSAHLTGVEDNFEKCWDLFNEIWEKYLPSMIEIKNELRPPVQQVV